MSRTLSEAERHAVLVSSSAQKFQQAESERLRLAAGWELWAARVLLLAVVAAMAWALQPFGLGAWPALTLGIFAGAAIELVEWRLQRAKLSVLLSGALGALLGVSAAALFAFVVSRTAAPDAVKSFLEFGALLGLGYLGLMLGASKGEEINPQAMETLFAERATGAARENAKLLDTSVLIDGRIADICDAQFLDGTLIVPQFVLHELQLVADSSDGLKRQRGRRGLDVLERMQKMQGITVRVINDDSLHGADVDHKLIEVAQRTGAKIVTNDFNLNKVATLQGLSVLNVNQLANALKPAVLPGEPMHVYILREGKEANQGVAYLDDGTMVVVDGARRFINKHVDILVTSVHQTTAGKMIFGRLGDRAENGAASAPLRQAAAAGAGRGDVGGRAGDAGSLDHGPRATFPEADAD